MKLNQLLERLQYEVVQGSDEREISTLANDSRKVENNSAFVCISGAVVDGHDFVEEVAAKGAAAVIVEKEIQAPDGMTVIRGNGYPLCAGADVSCIFWISGGKIKGDRNYRNKGEDHDNLYDQVHFGECGT